jgi:hypothetical protein
MKFEVPYYAIELSINPRSLLGLSSESLRQMKIFPLSWKTDREDTGPRCLSGISFENGVSFFANESTLRFSEPPSKKSLIGIRVPKMVRAYVAGMPDLEYELVNIQIMGHFRETKKEDRLFIIKSIKQSLWNTLGNLTDVELKLEYLFDDCLCELSVKRMWFGKEDEPSVEVITCFAEFQHPIEGKSTKKRLASINSVLDNINTDLNHYQEIVARLVNGKENS